MATNKQKLFEDEYLIDLNATGLIRHSVGSAGCLYVLSNTVDCGSICSKRGVHVFMKCIKCGEETDKVRVGIDFGMWSEEKKALNGTIFQEPKSPANAYVCPKCGYIEFYAHVK